MTHPMHPLISVEHLSLTYDSAPVLQDVSLSIAPHDFVTIVGPNGAGKSMLLKCLIGLVQPDSGTITRPAPLRIGYMPQRFQPDHTMPITAQRFLRLRQTCDSKTLENIAHETGICGYLDQPLHVLSGGELQRVLLTRALLATPDLLVLDEPAQNLDVSGQLSFYRLLEKIYGERQIAILMVSHDLHMVMASTRRVICLYHHICCTGEPHAVTQDPEFVALFGQDLSTMMAIYQHSHNHQHDTEHTHPEGVHHGHHHSV